MANKSCKSVISCCIFLLVAYLGIACHGLKEGKSILKENRLLPKTKGTIKTIESPEDGDVIDCIDFWQQPAFDNPVTKKFELMKPTKSFSNIFQMKKNESQLPTRFHKWNKYGECPKGTIPIRRARSDNATTIPHGKFNSKVFIRGDGYKHEYASAIYPTGEYNGASAILNLWNPYVEEGGHEFSVAQIWVSSTTLDDPNSLNTVEAGWQVNPNSPYGLGTATTFFTHWTNHRNKQWVLRVNNEDIGYWPPHLFTNLQHGADKIIWGGEIINDWKDNQHTITEMGSGHFYTQGFGQAAFFRQVMIKDDYHIWKNAHRNLLDTNNVEYPQCYNVRLAPDQGDTTFYYGGPGGPNCHL